MKCVRQACQIYKKIMMVPPTHFDVIHKNLNVHMTCEEPVDKVLAMQQWENLRRTYQDLGLQPEICQPHPGAVDMVYCANASVILNNKALVAGMNAEPRRQESEPFANWLRTKGFEVEEMDKMTISNTFCEGNAELSPMYDLSKYFYGWGIRATEDGYDIVTDFFSLDKKDVLKLKLVDDRFYHLDTCMAPLALGHLMFYSGAFDEESIKTIHNAIDGDKLIELTEEEALDFSCNSVSFFSNKDEAVVVSGKFSNRLKDLLQNLGYKCVEVEYNQFLKGGGSVRCSTLDIGQLRPQ